MEERYKTLLKASLSFAVGIAGLIYISKMPNPEPKYKIVESGRYTLIDANKDSSVDLIKVNNEDGHAPMTYMNLDKEKIVKKNYDMWIDFARKKPITPEIQGVADSVFKGLSDASKLENKLEEHNKK